MAKIQIIYAPRSTAVLALKWMYGTRRAVEYLKSPDFHNGLIVIGRERTAARAEQLVDMYKSAANRLRGRLNSDQSVEVYRTWGGGPSVLKITR